VVRIVAVRCALAACAAAVVLSALPALGADAYPTRPIRIIVPFTPGTLDVLARSIGQKLTEKYGQTIVVENRPGAGTIVGTDILAKSTPDGYTLEMITTTFVINPSLYKKLPYDPLRDFAPITQLDTVANILVVNPSMPANSLKELIALAKSKPGQLTYASPGSGSAPHIATELLKSMAGIDMVHVPYKGIPEAATDVIANRVTMLMTTTASAATFIKAGRLRALRHARRGGVSAPGQGVASGERVTASLQLASCVRGGAADALAGRVSRVGGITGALA